MATTSECTPDLEKLQLTDPNPSRVDASSDPELRRTPEQSLVSKSGNQPSVEQQIERSKCHWSEIWNPKLDSNSDSNPDCNDEDEAARVKADNEQVFQTLLHHPTWGKFFVSFGEGTGRSLKVGEKFAEGGQAELFLAHVTLSDPNKNELGIEYVLKVLKPGVLLRHLQEHLPQNVLEYDAERLEQYKLGKHVGVRRYCEVFRGTLLEDGRIAFLLKKETDDLRTLIDRNMACRIAHGCADCGPFVKIRAEIIMYRIALGMNWLHNRNVVHRDLKASNVLVTKDKRGKLICYVADFECSIGVVGTGFWRAPEILQALKDKDISQRLEVFSKEADVYAYGMTCYEILTGKLPFENHPWEDYDLVLNGQRLEMPEHVDNWARELLNKCWQFNPTDRPSFGEILDFLLAESEGAKRFDEKRREMMKEIEAGWHKSS